MLLESWVAIAEIVSAIAVVVTLIYLAIQIKHSKESLDANTKAIRGQAISDITRNVHDQMHMIIQGHDVAAAFLENFRRNESHNWIPHDYQRIKADVRVANMARWRAFTMETFQLPAYVRTLESIDEVIALIDNQIGAEN